MLPGMVATDSDLVAELLAQHLAEGGPLDGPGHPAGNGPVTGPGPATRVRGPAPGPAGRAPRGRGGLLLRAARRRPPLSGCATPTGSGRCAWAGWGRPTEPEGWVLASESPALDVIGATFVRELEPGELVIIDGTGVRSEQLFGRRAGRAPPVHLRVRLLRPARQPPLRPGGPRGPPADGRAAGRPGPGRGRPGHGGARVGGAGGRGLRPGQSASPTVRAWSRTATSAGPSSPRTSRPGSTGCAAS